jgi:hypothetical protein
MRLYHSSFKKPLLTMRTSGEDCAVNDIVWCPGNSTVIQTKRISILLLLLFIIIIIYPSLPYSQVFASVTASGKLQIWDLAYSSIDPVVNHDTSLDLAVDSAIDGESLPEPPATAATDGGGPMPMMPIPARRENIRNEDVKESAVAKLIRNLATESSIPGTNDDPSGRRERILTCVLFGEKSPTVVVGDIKGVVTLYRVFDPLTVLLEGPVQQTERFKSSIYKQIDPSDVIKLNELEKAEKST